MLDARLESVGLRLLLLSSRRRRFLAPFRLAGRGCGILLIPAFEESFLHSREFLNDLSRAPDSRGSEAGEVALDRPLVYPGSHLFLLRLRFVDAARFESLLEFRPGVPPLIVFIFDLPGLEPSEDLLS